MIYLITTIIIVYFSISIWFIKELKREKNMMNED